MMLYLVVLFGQIHVGGIRLECLCAVRVAQTLLLDGVHVLRHRRAATRYLFPPENDPALWQAAGEGKLIRRR